jgi:hypothetical protein
MSAAPRALAARGGSPAVEQRVVRRDDGGVLRAVLYSDGDAGQNEYEIA